MKTSTPYEFLVRINKDGTIAGAHVKFLDTYTDAGVIISQVEGEAQPVSMAGGAGFPIASILDSVQSAALVTVEAEKAKAAEAVTAQAAATKERDDAVAALTAEKAAHQQTIASKDAEIAALVAETAAA